MTTEDLKGSVIGLLAEDNDLMGASLRVSLFVSAMNSYKCDSLLKPFPNDYIDGQTKEKLFDDLKKDVNEIPPLDQLNGDYQLTDKCWKLLHWIMTCGSMKLIRHPLESTQVKDILPSSTLSSKHLKPSFVFQVVSPPKRAFIEAADRFGTFRAFHGSTAESFHSIAHNGLVNCLNKRSLFGSGTYVSSQLSVAIEFSPFGFGWDKSSLGREMSCVAVCQVVKHPDIMGKHSTNGVPNAYYVIRNDDMIKVSHILVYCKRKPSLGSTKQTRIDSAITSTLFRHRSSLVLVSLVAILVAIGLKFA